MVVYAYRVLGRFLSSLLGSHSQPFIYIKLVEFTSITKSTEEKSFIDSVVMIFSRIAAFSTVVIFPLTISLSRSTFMNLIALDEVEWT